MSYLVLKRDSCLLYLMVRAFLPKPNSNDSANAQTLKVIYFLMSGKPIDFSHYMLEYMSKVSSIRRPTPLPYANLLTLFFKHFGVCLMNKIRETKLVPTVSLNSLKHIQFFQTKTGVWRFIDEMAQDEKAIVSKKCCT